MAAAVAVAVQRGQHVCSPASCAREWPRAAAHSRDSAHLPLTYAAADLPSLLSCSASDDDEDGGWQHVGRGEGAVQGALPGQYKSIFNNFQEEEWNEEDIQV